MSAPTTCTCVLRPGLQWAVKRDDGALIGSFPTLTEAMAAAGLKEVPVPTVWNDNLNAEIPSA